MEMILPRSETNRECLIKRQELRNQSREKNGG